jgi:hypothetical protein
MYTLLLPNTSIAWQAENPKLSSLKIASHHKQATYAK